MAPPLKDKDKDQAHNEFANHVMENSWDDWVPQDRVRKFTDENKELAAQLHNQMKMLQQKAPKSGPGKPGGKRGANGSDFSSARGSEERTGSAAAQPGRGGPRRNRDYDLEHVSPKCVPLCFLDVWVWCLQRSLMLAFGKRIIFPLD